MLTPVGVLGVRGTHFRARTEDGQALTEVLDGRVAVNRELTSDDLPLNGRRPARKAAQAEPDEDVLVDARRGLKGKPQGPPRNCAARAASTASRRFGSSILPRCTAPSATVPR